MNDETRASADVTRALELDRSGGRRWRWGGWLALLAAVGVALAVYFRVQTPDAPAYVTEQPRRGMLRVTVSATGSLRPTNQVDVGSEVSGLIAEVFVDYNERVTRDQPLARLDTEALEARVASARASLAVAQASLAQAQATAVETRAQLARSHDLAEQNLISRQSLEADEAAAQRADAAVASARAQVTASEAALREAETALRKAVIRAPIDGMVIAREVEPGQTVAAAFQTPVLFRIAEDLTRMQLHLDLDESDVGLVREGQTADFRVDAYPNRVFRAQIVSVRYDPRTVNNVVTYETVLDVANPDLLLRPGMTATAEILVEERADALLVPNRALRFLPPFAEGTSGARADTEGTRVWVLRGGEPVAVPVTTGLTDGEFTEIQPGDLSPDADLIVDVERTPRPPGGGPFG